MNESNGDRVSCNRPTQSEDSARMMAASSETRHPTTGIQCIMTNAPNRRLALLVAVSTLLAVALGGPGWRNGAHTSDVAGAAIQASPEGIASPVDGLPHMAG